ncbi:T-cell surface glycoprotein CD1a-like isoform X4 [Equus asinus]|uniref:T-cell surface glycoprotein CD1a-like isoform X4 n=1 Tax=Equus asinus TaxID=9793 RepID=UPI0038F6FB96
MLFLQFLLLAVLLPGGDNKDDFQEPISFQIIQISSFYSRSWVQTLLSGWLGELQVQGWNTNPGSIIFLWPWSKGNFSNEEMMELENFFRGVVIGIHWAFYNLASEWRLSLKPKAWLSSGPSPHPGHLVLVCHVSGFYPKPIWVMWMLDDQEHPGTQQRDILPNADGTWYLRKSLDVKAIEAAGLSCRVRHSSLGGQDIILYWEHHISTGLIVLAVIVALVLLTGLAFWLWKCWIRHQLQRTLLPLD